MADAPKHNRSRGVIKSKIKLARAEVIDEDRLGKHIHRHRRRGAMRETVPHRLLDRAPVRHAHLVFLLILLMGSDAGRVAAKDEVKNTPPQISSVFPQ